MPLSLRSYNSVQANENYISYCHRCFLNTCSDDHTPWKIHASSKYVVRFHVWYRFPPLPQVMFALSLRHLRLAVAAGVHIIPKHHLALHLWDRAAVTGNPKEFANWYDEHLNATLANVAKVAYPTVYERRVLSYFTLAYRAQHMRRR